eukprot:CAMPEP_0113665812 /NCGR_PEP_ID=MMETSP0038_2-20120614/2510_1 /TAXON_ID=2898 /ORGANISM="Cryptomonas paramecium" /LENGTH=152 /DNA_ID=CAMNT_0000581201 /DNA_START=308 /DNA_END=763 /DNA_ORIENTATION=+ /assembly_acc=CAM_ASM_000170
MSHPPGLALILCEQDAPSAVYEASDSAGGCAAQSGQPVALQGSWMLNCATYLHMNESSACGVGLDDICEHNSLRLTCEICAAKESETSETSEAPSLGKRKREMKEARGAGGICEHRRQRSQCKECGGGGICEHGKVRSRCKDCGGGSICPHG